ncbi:MAG: hypothetical protein HYR96_00910 [Deltaproteobacteria bacterium]|nr:hypothetical protein [Deltaproteobacteria bacterium]MBI3296072.1 hypothetical protein [Deltaproteobacteria bacterium]
MKTLAALLAVVTLAALVWMSQPKGTDLTIPSEPSLTPVQPPSKRTVAPPTVTPEQRPARPVADRLNEFLTIQRKALTTQEERVTYETLLTDPELIENAAHTLGQAPTMTTDVRTNRMSAVEYLATSLMFETNPERPRILRSIKTFLLSAQSPDARVARTTAADKAELFSALTSSAPEEAKLLEERARGTTNAKVFQFSRSFFHLKSQGDL